MNFRNVCCYGDGPSFGVFFEDLISLKLLLMSKYVGQYEKSPSHTAHCHLLVRFRMKHRYDVAK